MGAHAARPARQWPVSRAHGTPLPDRLTPTHAGRTDAARGYVFGGALDPSRPGPFYSRLEGVLQVVCGSGSGADGGPGAASNGPSWLYAALPPAAAPAASAALEAGQPHSPSPAAGSAAAAAGAAPLPAAAAPSPSPRASPVALSAARPPTPAAARSTPLRTPPVFPWFRPSKSG
jgi:hypothetical protein